LSKGGKLDCDEAGLALENSEADAGASSCNAKGAREDELRVWRAAVETAEELRSSSLVEKGAVGLYETALGFGTFSEVAYGAQGAAELMPKACSTSHC
jgi:hypothetical protein